MQQALLAIDVGGSTCRAYLVDLRGHCLGSGRSKGGNPASNDRDFAATSIIAAVDQAAAAAGGGRFDIAVAQIALAGPQAHVDVPRLETAFGAIGLRGPILFAGDLVAMFTSVSLAPDGYCVVAGTGAGAIRVRQGEIERVVDLGGWLLGDLGSGYWLGHEAAKAAVADMEGRGPATALTAALLEAMAVPAGEGTIYGRPAPQRLFIDAIYAMRPIELARFARLVIAHPGDAVAAGLIAQAERYLISDFAIAYDPAVPGPIALGGGVMPHLPGVAAGVAEIVRTAGQLPDIHLSSDGSVGAVVLGLRSLGIAVDQPMFESITASIRERGRT